MRNKFRISNLKFKTDKGFTLIELLIAIAIVTILAVSVFVALNPAQRLQDAKDARRAADVDSILTAIHQSIVDNKGTYPSNMPVAGTVKQLGTGPDAATCPALASPPTDCVTSTICTDLMVGGQNIAKYLKTMPFDPDSTLGTSVKTGYSVERDANGIVTVKACYTDGSTTISASR